MNQLLAGLLLDGSLVYWYWWLPGRSRRRALVRAAMLVAVKDLRREIDARAPVCRQTPIYLRSMERPVRFPF